MPACEIVEKLWIRRKYHVKSVDKSVDKSLAHNMKWLYS